MYNILMLCTGNSVRSVLGEAILNRDGAGRVNAFSAGSNPAGQLHSGVISFLKRKDLPCSGYRSKSWEEFAAPGAPAMDLIITLCPATAEEISPIPGGPLSVHWPLDDPSAAPRDQEDLALQLAYHRLSARINAFLALPFERMEPDDLTTRLCAIGDL